MPLTAGSWHGLSRLGFKAQNLDSLPRECRELESSPAGVARPGSPVGGEGPSADLPGAEAPPQANGEAEAGSGSPSPKKGSGSTLKKQVSSAFKFFGLAAR